MKVKDLMSTSIVCVRPETSLKQIASLMKQENIGAIPICTDRNEILGIITDRDIVLRGMSSSLENQTAESIMSRNIVYATPNMNSHDAALLLSKNQVRRLPVLENGKLVGILALADIARKPMYIDEAGDALNSISKINNLY
ncbi:CBS domain-containing protein [Anaerovorax odorimutans]|uniref:CBS domain-containing protein n=1 Tax=Anaerovorax odorimutans TaxID=109327 RepID=UPI0003FDE40A|nr:CBS domain-containing protein [Anaerovorax odorimutans]